MDKVNNMSILTERLAQEIRYGISKGYVQNTDDTAAFLESLVNGKDIVQDFTGRPTTPAKGSEENDNG